MAFPLYSLVTFSKIAYNSTAAVRCGILFQILYRRFINQTTSASIAKDLSLILQALVLYW
jgi:hypothetical protein